MINHFGIYEFFKTKVKEPLEQSDSKLLRFCCQSPRYFSSGMELIGLFYLPINALKLSGFYDYEKLNKVIDFINSLNLGSVCSILGEEDFRFYLKEGETDSRAQPQPHLSKAVVVLIQTTDVQRDEYSKYYIPVVYLRSIYSQATNGLAVNIVEMSGSKEFQKLAIMQKMVAVQLMFDNRNPFHVDQEKLISKTGFLPISHVKEFTKEHRKYKIGSHKVFNKGLIRSELLASGLESSELIIKAYFSKDYNSYIILLKKHVWEVL